MTRRILVANQSRTLSALIRLTLADEPEWRIELVSDGDSALRSVEREPPDLVVVDLELQGGDGLALVEALRQAHPLTRVLLSAPDHAALDPARLRHLRIDEVLPRPFERQVLLARVRAILGEVAVPPPKPAAPALLTPIPAETAPAVDLSPLVAREVAQRLDALAGGALRTAIDQALERLLPAALAEAFRRLEPALLERLGTQAEGALRERAEAVAWKIVPELAESIIREEIQRLTQEGGA